MIKRLKDCKVGDVVRMYCIGWGRFDNQLSKIVDKGFFVKVKDENGTIHEFVDEAECQVFE